MPLASVKLVPGIDTEKTPTLNEAGISVSRLIRFRDKLAEKIGGWEAFYPFDVNGIVRAMHAWQDFNEVSRLAVGSTLVLAAITEAGAYSDITPQFLESSFPPDVSTTNGSASVDIDDPNIANVTTFDSVFFDTPVAIGGLVLSGLYPIALVLGATSFRITAGSLATSTSTTAVVPVFSTTNASSVVAVDLTAHGLSVGDTINFPISTTVGGVTVLGTYRVTDVAGADDFSIQVSALATSTTSGSMNGGEMQLTYRIALGPAAVGTGYGVGDYGEGGYGTGSTSSAQIGDPITATGWTHDNWGQTLLSCPAGGGVYYWEPNGGFQNASLVSSGPYYNGGIFVSMPAQILVAWGSTSEQTIGVDQDPLLVRWSDQLDYTVWEDTTTNQAGSFRIPNGSRIVGGMQGPQTSLLWTDLDVWAMQYVGFPLVYGFNKIGSSCGAISAHCMTQLGSTIFWMGRSNFFAMTGSGASPIPCTVWDVVFQDLDTDNLDKCWAWANTPFNEVWWFYPSESGGSGECDSYVKLNVSSGSWDYGPLIRTAGIDQSVLGMPIASNVAGAIFQHETGYDDDGSQINSSFTTGYWMVNDGNEVAFVDWIMPDMKWGTFNGDDDAQVQLTFRSVMYPGDDPVVHGPYTVNRDTKYVNTRIRGRQVSMEVESNDHGSFWRMGRIRYRWAPDGRR